MVLLQRILIYNRCRRRVHSAEIFAFQSQRVLQWDFNRKLQAKATVPWLKTIIWVIGALRRTVVRDWRFDKLCGSHLHIWHRLSKRQSLTTDLFKVLMIRWSRWSFSIKVCYSWVQTIFVKATVMERTSRHKKMTLVFEKKNEAVAPNILYNARKIDHFRILAAGLDLAWNGGKLFKCKLICPH